MANPKIQLRHDTAANWTSVNPVLLEGEVGIETDTKKQKIGDGSTSWNSLAYQIQDFISNIPVGLNLSIDSGILSAQAGHITSQTDILKTSSVISTADISTIPNGVTNGVILGETLQYQDVDLTSGVTYIYADADGTSLNTMTENSKGAWLIASSSQGRNSSSWAHYGLVFNTPLQAGQYKFSVSTGTSYGFLYACSGEIGNFIIISTIVNNEQNPQDVEVNIGSPIDALVWVVGNYNGWSAPYGLEVQKYESAKVFKTYLCKDNNSYSLKLATDTSALSSFDDYAQIGQVEYDNTLLNPVATPTEDLKNTFVNAQLANKDLSNLSSTGEAKFQAPLVSGTNIKTINNESILGSGNIDIQTGGTIDDSFSTTSENPLQNKIITNALMDVTTGSYYVYGSPTISNNIISNMSTSDYILTDYVWNCTSSDTWRLIIKIQDFDYTLTNSPMIFTNSLGDTKSIEIGFTDFYLQVKLSSNGTSWDIADTFYTSSDFIGGNTKILIQYDQYGSLYVFQSTAQGYWMQLASYSNSVYNTNSQMKIYNSKGSTGISIDLANSSMVVNSTTVWDGSGGAIAYTPKFQEKLVSGTNIKTINSTSLLGSGNIDTSEVFIAEYGVTSFSDIQTAHNAGKAVFCKINAQLIPLTDLSTTTCLFSYLNGNTLRGLVCDSQSTPNWSAINNGTFEKTSNKVTSLSSSSTDNQYPSAKCVYNELTNKADTDLSNLSSTGQKVIDGQWVGSYSQISTAKATGTYDIDLSSYLPNDNYNYEVYFFAHMYSSSTTYSKVYVKTSILSTAGETSGIRVGYVGTNSRQGVTNTILPIGADRILTIAITGRALDGSDTGFCLAGYRRIGTNS